MLMRTIDQGVEPKNLFLQRLNLNDRTLVGSLLHRTSVERGATLFLADEILTSIYFPETVIISIDKDRGSCPRIETAVVGHEGMVGWSALTGRACSAHNATVQMRSGTVLSISAADIINACALSKTLLMAVMCFIEIVMVQMGQTIVSQLRDTVDRRVCRWLLMRHDRTPSDHLLIKHEDIGASLNVRRASVTDCLHILEGEHLVKCFRGRIIIRNRKALEDRAGDSYGVAENHYRSLIGPFGRT